MTPENSPQVDIWLSEAAGERWRRTRDLRAQVMAEVTQLMLNLAGVRPGARVLDVAAGTGDTSIEAAQRVGPTGYVLATDLSDSMLAQAASAARKAGLSHLHTQVVDAQALALEPDSFDAAICRYGLMFIPDCGKALRAIHRSLKPGGKLAAIVWSSADKNPFMAIPVRAIQSRARLGYERPVAMAMRMGEPGMLKTELVGAGFRDMAIQEVAASRRFPSVAKAMEMMRDLPAGEAVSRLPEADADAAWHEIETELRGFETSDGCDLPSESLVGVGTK